MNVMCASVINSVSRVKKIECGKTYMIMVGVRSGNNAVSVVSAATVVGVGGDVRGV